MFKLKENERKAYYSFWNIAKALLRRKFLALNAVSEKKKCFESMISVSTLTGNQKKKMK